MDIFPQIKIQINEHLYLKDPASSELGRNILKGSIELIDSIGFDSFNFKKLAKVVGTTESSVYRYFESKSKLLLYLTNWYWGCIATRILFENQNIEDPEIRLKKAIHILTTIPPLQNQSIVNNEGLLKFIVINESAKVFFTKDIDEINRDGVFSVLKQLVEHVAQIILEINKNYPYSNMLVSNMIEGSNRQHFFAAHLPRLTNTNHEEDVVESFYTDLIFKAIKND
jgi:AcrR family transcriptional regulator